MDARPHEPGDQELMSASARGDSGAFELLVARHGDGVLTYLRGLSRNLEVAADLAQETFLAAWQARTRYSPDAGLRTWLFSIARNRYVSWVRRISRERTEAAASREPASPGVPPEERAERRELAARALGLLAGLPEVERETIVLRLVERMPYAEISALMNVPENALRSYASRGLARLREALA